MAVLPTPASPTSSGLFLRRRHSVCTHALELSVAADQRVDLASERQRVQVLRVVVERAVRGLGLAFLVDLLLAFPGGPAASW